MKMNPEISLIIPVYGVADYIKKCLLSIKAQSFKNFEAILVDDGSIDNSITIAKKVINNDPRFTILTKKNGGQGSARNMGLDHAQGNYISFIDSDDYIAPTFLEELYKKIKDDDADVCLCNINYVDPNGSFIKKFTNNVDKYYSKNDFLLCKYFISTFVCDKLFKKEMFCNMRFDESVKTYEDAHFTFRLIYKKRLTQVDSALYYYIQRPGSTSHSLNSSYIYDRIAVKNSHLNFAKKIATTDDSHSSYIHYCYLKSFVFFTSTTLARYSKDYSNDIKTLKTEVDPKIFTFKNILPIIQSEPKTGLSLFLFKISPTLFRGLVKLWFRNAIA